jgi:hypothetical protein
MATQTWIIEGMMYPPEQIPQELIRAQYSRPFSIAYFCPYCGEIWARRIVQGGDPQWVLWNKPCSKHPHSLSRGLSGSVWLGWGTDSDRNLPKAVLRREALLHIGAEYS